MDKKIRILKKYFEKETEVILAFLFGSRAKKLTQKTSDWDVTVYFRPERYLELEAEREYLPENKIWSDLIDILDTDNVDFVIMNRTKPDLVYSVLTEGFPLVIKDERLFWKLLCKTSYEAMDWWDFAFEFWKIGEKAKSLTKEAKFEILLRLRFLEKEWEEFDKFKKMNWLKYSRDSDKRRSVER